MSKKAKKISMCLIVMIAMTISAIPISSSAQTGSADGQSSFVEQALNPDFLKPVVSLTEAPAGYIGITTKEELNQVRNNLTANYILLNDIIFADTDFELGGAYYNGGLGWNPIGEYGYLDEFEGIFDGNGKTISGLTQNRVYTIADSWIYGGLFGYNSGEIKNLGMTNVDISASVGSSDTVAVGGIIGCNDGVVTNCYSSGRVAAPDDTSDAGGIAGENNGTISFSKNKSTISSYNFSGGVVGDNSGTVTSCVNTGNVATTDIYGYAGGIASYNYSHITKCYNAGYVKASWEAGGITSSNYNIISDCFNTGKIETTTSSSSAAGIAAYNGGSIATSYSDGALYNTGTSYLTIGGIFGYGTGTSSNCVYNSAYGVNGSGTGVSASQMRYQGSYPGFDFTSIWTLNTSIYRPVLNGLVPQMFSITYYLNGGILPIDSPTKYMMGSANKLSIPTRAGYTFGAWYKDSAFSGSAVTTIPYSSAATVSYYAKWVAPILAAKSYSYTSIKVSWAAAGKATSYKIYRATTATGTYSLVYTATSTARSWLDTGQTTGKYYYYKVYPVVSSKIYTHSTYKYAKAVPATPTVTLSEPSYTSIRVTWTGVSGATKYQIYRATSATGTYSLVYTAATTTRSWVNTGRTPGKYYYYKVRAYHLEGTTKVYGSFSVVKYTKM